MVLLCKCCAVCTCVFSTFISGFFRCPEQRNQNIETTQRDTPPNSLNCGFFRVRTSTLGGQELSHWEGISWITKNIQLVKKFRQQCAIDVVHKAFCCNGSSLRICSTIFQPLSRLQTPSQMTVHCTKALHQIIAGGKGT